MLLVYGVKNDNRLNCCFFNTLFQKKFNFQVKKILVFQLIFFVLICVLFSNALRKD